LETKGMAVTGSKGGLTEGDAMNTQRFYSPTPTPDPNSGIEAMKSADLAGDNLRVEPLSRRDDNLQAEQEEAVANLYAGKEGKEAKKEPTKGMAKNSKREELQGEEEGYADDGDFDYAGGSLGGEDMGMEDSEKTVETISDKRAKADRAVVMDERRLEN